MRTSTLLLLLCYPPLVSVVHFTSSHLLPYFLSNYFLQQIIRDLIQATMASSSSTHQSIQKKFKYDVFVSFIGEDIRHTFIDHLYTALRQQGIHPYMDDEKIEKGNNELLKSIEDSKFLIIVFSKNYASSSRCLKELVKILECSKTTDHTVYPVFYDVDPSQVRFQSYSQEAGKWRSALKAAADLSGWDLSNVADR